MRKIITIMCICAITLSMAVGCSKTDNTSSTESSSISEPNIVESEFLKKLKNTDSKNYQNLDEISTEIAKEDILSYPLTIETTTKYGNTGMYFTQITSDITAVSETDYENTGSYWKAETINNNEHIAILISKNISEEDALKLFKNNSIFYGYGQYNKDEDKLYIVPFIYGIEDNYKSITENINMLENEITKMSKNSSTVADKVVSTIDSEAEKAR